MKTWTTVLAMALGSSLSVKYSAVLLVAAALVLFALQLQRTRWRRDATVLARAVLVAWALHGFATAQPRFVAISATLLQGVALCGDPLAGFRSLTEDGRAGYSIFIYSLARSEVVAALSNAVTDPCTP